MADKYQLVGGLVIAIASSWTTVYFTAAKPQRIEYSVRSTSIGADASLKTLLPEAEITVGDRSLASLALHTVTVKAVEGDFVGAADGAIDFSELVELLGPIRTLAPSSAHSVNCEPHSTVSMVPASVDGIVCRFEPLDSTGNYEVGFATSRMSPLRFSLPAEHVQLLRTEEVSDTNPESNPLVYASTSLLPALVVWAGFYAVDSWYTRRVKGRLVLDDVQISHGFDSKLATLNLVLLKRSGRDIEVKVVNRSQERDGLRLTSASSLDRFLLRNSYNKLEIYDIEFENPPAPGVLETAVDLQITYGKPDALKYNLPIKGHLAFTFDARGQIKRSKWQDTTGVHPA